MDDVARLMRDANPVPDTETALMPGGLDALLLLTKTRSGNMDVKQTESQAQIGPAKRRGLLVGAAALAAVLIIGAALLFSRNSNAPELLGPESLAGNEWTVVGGTAGTLPQRLELDEDGAFRDRQGAVHLHHPQQDHHGDGRPVNGCDHAGTRRVPAGHS